MSYDKLRKEEYDHGYKVGYVNGYKVGKAERPHSEWIPCSERLPKDDRPVLIYAWNVHHVVARYGQFRTEDGGYKKAWVTAGAWFDNTEIKHKVIAWMPLPEFPTACPKCGTDMRKKLPCDNCIDDSDCDRCDVPRERR